MCWNTALLKVRESNYGEKGALHETNTNTTKSNPGQNDVGVPLKSNTGYEIVERLCFISTHDSTDCDFPFGQLDLLDDWNDRNV